MALALTAVLVTLGWLAPASEAASADSPATTPPAAASTPAAITPATSTPSTTAIVFTGATTTTKPTPPTSVAPTTTTTKVPASKAHTTAPTTTTSTTAPATPPTTVDAAMIAIANSVRRSAPSNDTALLTALVPLEKQLGYTAQQAEIVGMGQFPVAGLASYTDDWLEYRATPTPHNHMGDDIIAALGTPIRAPVNGILTYDSTDPDGYGLAADVTGPDKTEYVMAHMNGTVPGLKTGSTVTMGEVVGFVGDSGDATGPHVHFEVHPHGGAGVDPKAILDAWVAVAIKAVPALIASLEPTTGSLAATAAPLQLALPAPRAGFTQSLPASLPISKTPGGSLAGLGLVGLLALLASSSLSLARFRPWPLKAKVAGAGPDEPHGGPPKQAR